MKTLHILIILLIILPFGLTAQNDQSLRKKKNKDAPPGTVWLKENIYIDQTEITNIDYREFIHWLARVKGKDSKAYKEALPDTTVWRTVLSYNEPYVEHYFRHPEYDYYPVVGVTPFQAEIYCQWRTERVKEEYLVFDKVITYDDLENPEKRAEIDSLIAAYPLQLIFRLPTEAEWEYAAQGGNPDAVLPWAGSKMYKSGIIKARISACKNDLYFTGDELNDFTVTAPTDYYWPNAYDMYALAGNVAEPVYKNKPVDPENKEKFEREIRLKGGSWRHSGVHCLIRSRDRYEQASDHIGFRCVCEFDPEIR